MNNKVKAIITAIIAGGALFFGWVFLRRHNQAQDIQNTETMLKPNEESAVIINPIKRNIIIVRPNGVSHKMDLPDRPSRISVLKNGKVWVDAPQWGTEIRPFLLGAYDLKGGKLGAGLDVFYYKRVDLGVGFDVDPSRIQDTNLFVGVSCFVYSNTSVMLGVTNQETPMIGIKVRF